MDQPLMPKSLSDIQAEVTELGKKFGTKKISLVYGDDGSKEGAWCCPADQESADRFNNDTSHDEVVYARLQHQPLGWARCLNGCLVKACTRGVNRPEAFESEQFVDRRLKEANEIVRRAFSEWRRTAMEE